MHGGQIGPFRRFVVDKVNAGDLRPRVSSAASETDVRQALKRRLSALRAAPSIATASA
ncbi:MAG: hypothetical protein IPM07_14355 [Anaerolineales bacterium]|nr:hypothetical protein [Anaerolineales bacterium]